VSETSVRASRLRRAAALGTAAAKLAAREGAARAMRMSGGDSEKRRAAATRQQLKAAESLAKVFSGMRGAAMKIGQTLSAVDLGLVPEEVRPRFQEILSQLQQDAKPVSFKAIRKVIEEDLGEKLDDAFAEFEREPIAAASIGQVHRARLHDGRRVVVKVQYPGIAEAINADLKNLRLGLKLLNVIAPGIDTAAIADEIRERISEELDYELEAANHRAMARVYRGHPFIVVPDVVTSLCRERMIVTEYVEGGRLADALKAPQEMRDRYAEILMRFYLNGPMRHRLLNGDPHPGNSLFLPDGRIAFVDFGFFKHLSDDDVSQLVASTRATIDSDAERLLEVVADLCGLPPDPALAGPFLEHYQAIFGWLLQDKKQAIDPSSTARMMEAYTSLRDEEGFGGMTLPAEHFVLLRAIFLLVGLLGQLGAEGKWIDIAAEWLYDAPPVTELGRREAEFFGDRHGYTTTALAA